MRVRVFIRTDKRGLPAIVTVRNGAGRLLYCKRAFYRGVEARFCTKDGCIAVTVKPLDESVGAVTRYLRLSSCPCQSFRLYFGFNEAEYGSEQTFTLFDSNYGFPVLNALLKFFGR